MFINQNFHFYLIKNVRVIQILNFNFIPFCLLITICVTFAITSRIRFLFIEPMIPWLFFIVNLAESRPIFHWPLQRIGI